MSQQVTEEERRQMERGENVPSGEVRDDSYTMGSQTSGGPVPVQSDEAPVESPYKEESADTEEQLRRDDVDVDPKNILGGERLRHAKPKGPGYSEGPEESDLPQESQETGRSRPRAVS
ncbi:hypothetical protein POJ06DRAFT_236990 [Lipomyces tetrasporus]|uniref:Histone chaperone domain-containing protein n=1 Tax=Lipomyces tetrasporus TaxID=54092 RepID=A0AAD7VTR6_9ASCO|nr:uncharacterized protein POJ06DRAFT_236990 [Lipomyces tetrasporus]KAJ8102382.1 hypothetical protein POJ06DRAFT_236990 [Lipomyces tetrasporus]